MRKSNDIETAIYEWLEGKGWSASAHELPATLGTTLPHVHVTRTGGYTSDMVIEGNNVDLDVYAEDAADAMTYAGALCAAVRELPGETIGTPCYESEVMTLPYDNPDPRHPTIRRATFKAQILCRTKGE